MNKIAATLALVLVVSPLAAASPAQAGGDTIRYVAMKDCSKPVTGINFEPCGPLWLRMKSGKRKPFRGGPKYADRVAVSANGRTLAYFRSGDKRLAVRDLGGKERLLPKNLGPFRHERDLMQLTLSQDGKLLAVGCCNVGPPYGRVRVYNTGSGALLGLLPSPLDDVSMEGFSGDGDEALLRTEEKDSELVVTSLSGKELLRASPPKEIASNSQEAALAGDGRRVAVYVPGKKPMLKVYDLLSDQITASVALPATGRRMVRDDLDERLVEEDTAVDLTWTGDSEVTVTRDLSFPMPARVTVFRVDVAEGAVKVADSYAIPKGIGDYAVAGLYR